MEETLRYVVIVHRHGARLPTKFALNDRVWPDSPEFQNLYRGVLSPVGHQQARTLGKMIGKRYSALFSGLSQGEIASRVRSNCSNHQRSIMSAWSFWSGMFPEMPIQLIYGAGQDESDKIALVVESYPSFDSLFHLRKGDSDLVDWQRDNISGASCTQAALRNPSYWKLVDELYDYTGLEGLEPSLPLVDRIVKLKSLNQYIHVARAHGYQVYDSLLGGEEDASEAKEDKVALIESLSVEIASHKFRSRDGLTCHGQGFTSVAHLNDEIVALFESVVEGMREPGMQTFSGHETTLLALDDSYGLRTESIPGFVGYYLYELHQQADGVWEVRVHRNPNPLEGWIEPKYWPPSCFYQKWEELKPGSFPLEEFSERFSWGSYRAVKAKILGQECELEVVESDLPFLFRYFDQEKKGYLTPDDLLEAFRRFGYEVKREELRAYDCFDDFSDHMLSNDSSSGLAVCSLPGEGRDG